MKILHIINSLNTGGAEKLIVDIIPLLEKRKDIDVELLLLNGKETLFYKELISKTSIKIHFLSRGSMYNPLFIFKIIPMLKRYDIVHAHLFPTQYFVVLAKLLSFSKTKLVLTAHNTSDRRLENPKFRGIEKFIYNHYTKIICITEDVKTELIRILKIPKEKLKVIFNGINIDVIDRQKKYNRIDFNFSIEDKLLIMVAIFRTQKDHDTLIKCVKKLSQDYKLILVGDGERRQYIENLIEKEQLEKRVFLFGMRNDVIPIIKMCDVAVLSSHWEGFGLSAAEAMACGIPMVASNVQGLNKVVENGGLLFEKGNIDDLKEKIESLENTEYYNIISEKGREKSKKYDIHIMVNELVKLYHDLGSR